MAEGIATRRSSLAMRTWYCWLPCFVLECDDVTTASADPTQRCSSWDIELSEDVGVARTNDRINSSFG
jgi:hypothetical protein